MIASLDEISEEGEGVLEKETWEADWNQIAEDALAEALKFQLNNNVAKNVIMFLGDGMGVSTVTVGRIYAGQIRNQTGEEFELAFDKFPHVSLSKTYNVDRQTPDSAGTATAYLCGEKANLGVIGVNQRVLRKRCDTMSADNNIESILHWSLAEGKRTGVVTTTRITHATPAASYAHSPDRDFEADNNVPIDDRNNSLCKDIAAQLIENNPNINVILGGGRQMFLPISVSDPEYGTAGRRTDGKDLIQIWQDTQASLGHNSRYVWNQTEFDLVNVDTTDYLLGLFEPSHMLYTLERNVRDGKEPTLAQMTDKAIKILRRESKGYFLLVEGGRIDHGHHANSAKNALADLDAFNDAIELAVALTDESDTLIVVTADHSHAFTMGGYPSRGNPILAFTDDAAGDDPANDGFPYLTLGYANGPTGGPRTNLTLNDTTADNFLQPSHVPMGSETHGGEDVAVYARGPMSHLFHGVQEQHYIPHAMAYASCVGKNRGHCIAAPSTSSLPTVPSTSSLGLPTTVSSSLRIGSLNTLSFVMLVKIIHKLLNTA